LHVPPRSPSSGPLGPPVAGLPLPPWPPPFRLPGHVLHVVAVASPAPSLPPPFLPPAVGGGPLVPLPARTARPPPRFFLLLGAAARFPWPCRRTALAARLGCSGTRPPRSAAWSDYFRPLPPCGVSSLLPGGPTSPPLPGRVRSLPAAYLLARCGFPCWRVPCPPRCAARFRRAPSASPLAGLNAPRRFAPAPFLIFILFLPGRARAARCARLPDLRLLLTFCGRCSPPFRPLFSAALPPWSSSPPLRRCVLLRRSLLSLLVVARVRLPSLSLSGRPRRALRLVLFPPFPSLSPSPPGGRRHRSALRRLPLPLDGLAGGLPARALYVSSRLPPSPPSARRLPTPPALPLGLARPLAVGLSAAPLFGGPGSLPSPPPSSASAVTGSRSPLASSPAPSPRLSCTLAGLATRRWPPPCRSPPAAGCLRVTSRPLLLCPCISRHGPAALATFPPPGCTRRCPALWSFCPGSPCISAAFVSSAAFSAPRPQLGWLSLLLPSLFPHRSVLLQVPLPAPPPPASRPPIGRRACGRSRPRRRTVVRTRLRYLLWRAPRPSPAVSARPFRPGLRRPWSRARLAPVLPALGPSLVPRCCVPALPPLAFLAGLCPAPAPPGPPAPLVFSVAALLSFLRPFLPLSCPGRLLAPGPRPVWVWGSPRRSLSHPALWSRLASPAWALPVPRPFPPPVRALSLMPPLPRAPWAPWLSSPSVAVPRLCAAGPLAPPGARSPRSRAPPRALALVRPAANGRAAPAPSPPPVFLFAHAFARSPPGFPGAVSGSRVLSASLRRRPPADAGRPRRSCVRPRGPSASRLASGFSAPPPLRPSPSPRPVSPFSARGPSQPLSRGSCAVSFAVFPLPTARSIPLPPAASSLPALPVSAAPLPPPARFSSPLPRPAVRPPPLLPGSPARLSRCAGSLSPPRLRTARPPWPSPLPLGAVFVSLGRSSSGWVPVPARPPVRALAVPTLRPCVPRFWPALPVPCPLCSCRVFPPPAGPAFRGPAPFSLWVAVFVPARSPPSPRSASRCPSPSSASLTLGFPRLPLARLAPVLSGPRRQLRPPLFRLGLFFLPRPPIRFSKAGAPLSAASAPPPLPSRPAPARALTPGGPFVAPLFQRPSLALSPPRPCSAQLFRPGFPAPVRAKAHGLFPPPPLSWLCACPLSRSRSPAAPCWLFLPDPSPLRARDLAFRPRVSGAVHLLSSPRPPPLAAVAAAVLVAPPVRPAAWRVCPSPPPPPAAVRRSVLRLARSPLGSPAAPGSSSAAPFGLCRPRACAPPPLLLPARTGRCPARAGGLCLVPAGAAFRARSPASRPRLPFLRAARGCGPSARCPRSLSARVRLFGTPLPPCAPLSGSPALSLLSSPLPLCLCPCALHRTRSSACSRRQHPSALPPACRPAPGRAPFCLGFPRPPSCSRWVSPSPPARCGGGFLFLCVVPSPSSALPLSFLGLASHSFPRRSPPRRPCRAGRSVLPQPRRLLLPPPPVPRLPDPARFRPFVTLCAASPRLGSPPPRCPAVGRVRRAPAPPPIRRPGAVSPRALGPPRCCVPSGCRGAGPGPPWWPPLCLLGCPSPPPRHGYWGPPFHSRAGRPTLVGTVIHVRPHAPPRGAEFGRCISLIKTRQTQNSEHHDGTAARLEIFTSMMSVSRSWREFL